MGSLGYDEDATTGDVDDDDDADVGAEDETSDSEPDTPRVVLLTRCLFLWPFFFFFLVVCLDKSAWCSSLSLSEPLGLYMIAVDAVDDVDAGVGIMKSGFSGRSDPP